MANSYYTPSGTPGTNAQGSSSDIRSEFALIETGMDKLPSFTADYVVTVNAGGTALEAAQFLTVAQGGTGAATLTDGGILLGSGTGAVTATAVLADGEMLVGDGTTDPAIESGATLRTSIGVGTGDSVTFNDMTLSTALSVASGGTGAATFTDGGMLVGNGTGAIEAMAVLADGEMIVGDGTTTPVAESGATLRTSIGLGALATEDNINNGDWSGTDLGVNNGGTGVSTLAAGGILLGSNTSPVTVMAQLADGEMVVGTGVGDPVAESGATLRTSMGLGTGDSVTFNDLTLSSSMTVAAGGTGATTFTDGGVLIGNGTGAIEAMAVLADGEMIVGDGTTTPVAESGATLRTSIGLGALATQSSINNDDWSGTDLSVSNGGTGASTFTNGGVLLGSSTSAITAMAVLASGEMIVGDGVTDPVAQSGATLRTTIGVGYTDTPRFTGLTVQGDIVETESGSDTNTRLGIEAGASIAGGGINNTFYGYRAGEAVTTSDDNTAIGRDALLLSTGNDSTCVGDNAGAAMLTAGNLTAVGSGCLDNATGTNNTAIGTHAGNSITTGNHNTCLGAQSDANSATGVHSINIGYTAQGDQNYQCTIGSLTLYVKNEFDTDASWSQASDRRRKCNIQPAVLGLDFINDLNTVTYNLRPASELPPEWEVPADSYVDTEKTMHSLIAQDVLEAILNAGVDPDSFAGWGCDKQGQRISKDAMVIPLIKAVQELTVRLEALEEQQNA